MKFNAIFHRNFVSNIKNQISLREDEILELEDVYFTTQNCCKELEIQFNTKSNRLNCIEDETSKILLFK